MRGSASSGSRPTTRYVLQLLISLLRGETRGLLVLHESDPLPSVEGSDLQTAGDYRRVTNRLKVMANLTPMQYAAPLSGMITFIIGGREAAAQLEFHDYADEPRVHIRCSYTVK